MIKPLCLLFALSTITSSQINFTPPPFIPLPQTSNYMLEIKPDTPDTTAYTVFKPVIVFPKKASLKGQFRDSTHNSFLVGHYNLSGKDVCFSDVKYKRVNSDTIPNSTEKTNSTDTPLEKAKSNAKHNSIITPVQTDSIIVLGKTGYPSNEGDLWMFHLQDEVRIPLFSAHPEKNLFVCYINNEKRFTRFPPMLITSKENIANYGLLTAPKTDLADTLSRSPRLFCDYSYNSLYVVQNFNRQSDSKLLPAELGMVVSPLTKELYNSRAKKRRVDELLALHPENVVGLCKKAELLIKDEEYAAAHEIIAKAKENSFNNDYLIAYTEGLIYEAQDNIRLALKAYSQAITFSQSYDGPKIRTLHETMNRKIVKFEKSLSSSR